MKRTLMSLFALIFSISFCMAQNIQEAKKEDDRIKKVNKAEADRVASELQAAEKARQAAEAQKQLQYQEAIASAERNLNQGAYEQAQQDYKTALELKPENAASIDPKIAEIDGILLNDRYEKAIASAENNFNQRRYAQAIQDYTAALGLKPGNAASINPTIAEIERKMKEPALLYIYRKRKPLDITPKRYDIFLDNTVVANSTGNWRTTVTVNASGTQTVSATIGGREAEVLINFEPGGVYYVRSDVDSKKVDTGRTKTTTDKNGKTTTSAVTETQYTPTLQLVSLSVGESEYNAIKIKK